jgi:hypothetical protein
MIYLGRRRLPALTGSCFFALIVPVEKTLRRLVMEIPKPTFPQLSTEVTSNYDELEKLIQEAEVLSKMLREKMDIINNFELKYQVSVKSK